MAKRPRSITQPLGMLEWKSVAGGMLATDALLKEAEVTPVLARVVTPGHYVALFLGEVDAVRMALKRGAETSPADLLDSLFLAQPDQGLVPALGAKSGLRVVDAAGVIETRSLCSLLLAADGAAKTASVELVEIRLAMGLMGKAFCVLTGEVSQVESAVARGTELARERGYHLRSVVIPRPDPGFADILSQPCDPFSSVEL